MRTPGSRPGWWRVEAGSSVHPGHTSSPAGSSPAKRGRGTTRSVVEGAVPAPVQTWRKAKRLRREMSLPEVISGSTSETIALPTSTSAVSIRLVHTSSTSTAPKPDSASRSTDSPMILPKSRYATSGGRAGWNSKVFGSFDCRGATFCVTNCWQVRCARLRRQLTQNRDGPLHHASRGPPPPLRG